MAIDPELKALLQEEIRLSRERNNLLRRGSGGGTGGGTSGGGVSSAIADALGLGSALAGVASVAAGVTAALGSMAAGLYAVRKLVENINPMQADLFDQSLKDLSATIGTSLVPVLSIATGVINEISGILLPAMQALRPLFQSLANTIANVAMTAIQNWASILQTFMPGLQILVNLFEVLGNVVQVINTVATALLTPALTLISVAFQAMEPIVSAVNEALKQWTDIVLLLTTIFQLAIRAFVTTLGQVFREIFGDAPDLKSAIKQLGEALKEMAVQMIVFAAQVAKFLGLDRYVANFKKAIDEQVARPRGARAVNISAQTDTLSGISNKIAVAAAQAQYGAGQRVATQEELLKRISEGLAGAPTTILEDIMVRAGVKIWERVKGRGLFGVADAMPNVPAPARPVAGALFGPAAGLIPGR